MRARHVLRLAVALCAEVALCRLPPAAAQDAGLANPMRAVEKGTLKGFVERPLFAPSRRLAPAVPQAVAVEEPPAAPVEPPPALHLLGVIRGRRDMAVLQRDGQQKTIILRAGERIDGWTLTITPPVGIRLRNGDRTSDYALFGKPGVDPRAPTPAFGAASGKAVVLSDENASTESGVPPR